MIYTFQPGDIPPVPLKCPRCDGLAIDVKLCPPWSAPGDDDALARVHWEIYCTTCCAETAV